MPNLRPYFEPKPKPTTTLNPSLVIYQIGRTLWSLEIRMDISVVKSATIHTVLTLALTKHGLVHQPDVKNSFLSGDLSETVYMHQPLGFVDPRYPHHICPYMHDPLDPHSPSLKRILCYVQSTLEFGLQLYAFSGSSLVAYSDADWAGYSATCRSTSGYCVFMGNNILSWSAKRQHTLSCFSAEAEYQAVANVVAETAWLRNLL
uniref:Ribonuclease H-like domain-containing protein n=1 Tax=Tanacetum cinerariifolium TaxID=118510 RepID=A0A699I134_TANCI|nr:ribonuclease H-like domain-containing protein [Tanacetum cinerariifolium]